MRGITASPVGGGGGSVRNPGASPRPSRHASETAGRGPTRSVAVRPARPSTPGGQPTCDPAREQGDGGSAGTPGSRCTQQASGHGARVGPSLSHPLGASARCLRRAEGTAPWDTWEKQRPTSPRACCDRRPPCRPSGLVHPFLRGLCPRHLADDEGRLREGRGSPESTAPGGGAQVRARPTHNGCPRGVRAGAVDTAAMPRVA